MSGKKAKYGPAREYPPEQLAIYAQHKEQRATVRPLACQDGEGCWVEVGPPGLTTRGGGTNAGYCVRCGGLPKLPPLINRLYRR